MPSAAVKHNVMAGWGPPAPPELIIYTGDSGSVKRRFTSRQVKRNTTRRATTKRNQPGCC